MKCSINEQARAKQLVEQNWEAVTEKIEVDLELTARETKAIQRVRGIQSAGDLLRLILCYAVSGWGLRMTGAWALLNGIGYLSDVAVMKRIRNSCEWLRKIVSLMMQQRCTALRSTAEVRLRLVDATCISHPGSNGIDWRLHLGFDLSNLCIDQLELTDRHGGENLVRFAPQGNEIILADSGYAFASGIGPLMAAGAGLVVRINWRNVAVHTPQGKRFHIIPWLKTLTAPAETPVELKTPDGWFSFRLLAAPIPPEKAEAARRRVRKRYQRKQTSVSEETLFAAGFVILLTNLPADPWPPDRILWLYRIRWQIETLFKRLKGLILLDHLRAKDPKLAQAFLLAKLLLALLVDQMTHQVFLRQTDWFLSIDKPVNLSRLTCWFHEWFRQLIMGPASFHSFVFYLCVLRRYFCDTPRNRLQQLALARALFQHICLSSPFPLS